jgi:hypothetical protein
VTIPKIIFQTWKTRHPLPALFEIWRGTLIEKNPGYRHILWDHRMVRRFIARFYPWFLPTFDSYEMDVMRVDAVRFFFLYRFGGIYIDIDTEGLRPLDDLLDSADVVLTWMGREDGIHAIPSSIMLSRPKQEFWLFVLHMLEQKAPGRARPEHKTGPVMLKEAVELYRDDYESDFVQQAIRTIRAKIDPAADAAPIRSDVSILPGRILHPLDWTDPVHQYYIRRRVLHQGSLLTEEEKAILFPQAYLLHYCAHTWEIDRWSGFPRRWDGPASLHTPAEPSAPYRRLEGLDCEAVPEGAVAYVTAGGQTHFLNSAAAMVFELCDGQRSPEAIAELMREAFGLADAPKADVEACLALLRSQGLIES